MVKKTNIKKLNLLPIPSILRDKSADWVIVNNERGIDNKMLRIHKILEGLGHRYLTGDCKPPLLCHSVGYIVKSGRYIYYKGRFLETHEIMEIHGDKPQFLSSNIRPTEFI